MAMQKKKKLKRVAEPDAMFRNWPEIVENPDAKSAAAALRPTAGYSMGKLYISYSPEWEGMPAILSVNHPDRLPGWDEIVWIRYNVCPDIEDMACILPSLDHYINYSHGRHKNTMTMEDITIRRSMR